MTKFQSLVKAKGWSVDEVYDLLRHGAMFHCQPSNSCVAKWISGDRIPNSVHTLALLEFIQTHSQNGISGIKKEKK